MRKLVAAAEDLFDAAANAANDTQDQKTGDDSNDDPSRSGNFTVGHFAGLVKSATIVSQAGSTKMVVDGVLGITDAIFDSFANAVEPFLDLVSSILSRSGSGSNNAQNNAQKKGGFHLVLVGKLSLGKL